MIRLALLIVHLLWSTEAFSANVADWSYEPDDALRHAKIAACQAASDKYTIGICQLRYAADEKAALYEAQYSMGLCGEYSTYHCDTTRAYIRKRWGF